MLTNKKSLTEINDRIEKLNGTVLDNNSSIKSIEDTMLSLKEDMEKRMEDLRTDNSQGLKRYDDEIARFSKLTEEFRKRLDSFQIMEKKAIDILTGIAKEKLEKNIDIMRNASLGYQELQDELLKVNSTIKPVSAEIKKFSHLAGKVKEVDFTLERYANELRKNDKEKLRLMGENEKLRKLLAKERRNTRH